MQSFGVNGCSLPLVLLDERRQGQCLGLSFERTMLHWMSYRQQQERGGTLGFDSSIRLLVPMGVESRNRALFQTTMDLCTEHNRFLLCGSNHGLVSIFDLSPWGVTLRQKQTKTSTSRIHEPIQQAFVPASSTSSLSLCTLVSCRWYPTDSGAFITASRGSGSPGSQANDGGSIHLWDTNQMTPVLAVRPFRYDPPQAHRSSMTSVSAMEPCPHPSFALTAAASSLQSNAIKLLDLRSGASSHTLQSNSSGGGGVSALAWSPTHPYILASAAAGVASSPPCMAVSLWDIRKPGSLAYLTTLDEEYHPTDSSITVTTTANKSLRKRSRDIDTHKTMDSTTNKRQQPSQSLTGGTSTTTAHTTARIKLSHPSQRPFKDKKPLLQLSRMPNTMTKSPNNYNNHGILQNHHFNYRSTSTNSSTSTAILPATTATASAASHGSTGGGIGQLQFHPSGHFLVTYTPRDGDLRLWDLRTPVVVGCSSIAARPHHIPRRFLCPDGVTLPANNNASTINNNLRILITENSYCYHRNFEDNGVDASPKHYFHHTPSRTCSVIWLSHNRRLYGYSLEDGGTPIMMIRGHHGPIQSFVLNSNTNNNHKSPLRIITSATDGLILAWGGSTSNFENNSKSNNEYRRSHDHHLRHRGTGLRTAITDSLQTRRHQSSSNRYFPDPNQFPKPKAIMEDVDSW